MRLLITVIVASFIFISCNSKAVDREKENLAIAKKYMEAVEKQDVAAMDSLLADNYMGYGPSVGDSIDKAGALENFKINAEYLYESFEYTRHKEMAVSVTEGEAQGDWVLNWAYLTLKFKDGQGPVNLWVNAVYRIENGKIVHSRTFYNEADALRQLGYTMGRPARND